MSESIEHIVRMANDIGDFFRAEPDRKVAIDGISNHINKFWTRRMREKLLEYARQGGEELNELPRAALEQVTVAPVPRQPAAGVAAVAGAAVTGAASAAVAAGAVAATGATAAAK